MPTKTQSNPLNKYCVTLDTSYFIDPSDWPSSALSRYNPHYVCASCSTPLGHRQDRLASPNKAVDMVITKQSTILCWHCFASNQDSP